ncbi:hypothetical protein [Phaffia rhodozyma]|uniref:Uncharacterized protein n=1 Tax=Phaffia rhodozyma TaxID=264483 RepID=A0A0F7SSZ0_PHARH|nr:hypothetical protein [Phaffia rhodozyma]
MANSSELIDPSLQDHHHHQHFSQLHHNQHDHHVHPHHSHRLDVEEDEDDGIRDPSAVAGLVDGVVEDEEQQQQQHQGSPEDFHPHQEQNILHHQQQQQQQHHQHQHHLRQQHQREQLGASGLTQGRDLSNISEADIQSILTASQILQSIVPQSQAGPATTSRIPSPLLALRNHASPASGSSINRKRQYIELSDGNEADVDEIEDVDYLREEVKRLRMLLRERDASNKNGEEMGRSGSTGPGGNKAKKKDDGSIGMSSDFKRDETTGKRESTDRKGALNKAVRSKMRNLMGIADDAPLPDPVDPLLPQPLSMNGTPLARPNWNVGLKSIANKDWIEIVATQVINEGYQTLRSPESAPLHAVRIPEDDLDLEKARKAARTAFGNFVKKYAAQNDPLAKIKAVRDAKRGRRWARKDLKQRKRTKAATDPTFNSQYAQHPYPHVLRIDYMSSEYSSEGEGDGPGRAGLGPGVWDSVAGKSDLISGGGSTPGAGGISQGGEQDEASKAEKVLEVRTPRWRSGELNTIYAELDSIAAAQSKAIKGNFYTAPLLRRFKLNPLRDLPPPADPTSLTPFERWEFDPSWLDQSGQENERMRKRLGLAGGAGSSSVGMGLGGLGLGVGMSLGHGGDEIQMQSAGSMLDLEYPPDMQSS